jgi:hypothetical protein
MKKDYLVSKMANEQYDLPVYCSEVKDIKEEVVESGESKPYIKTKVTLTAIFEEYNPEYGDDKLCKCGHPYYRHFDSYEGMRPAGCKYCMCNKFEPAEEGKENG